MTIGREGRPLCTEDPKKHAPLPENSETWDNGVSLVRHRLDRADPPKNVIAPDRLYVSSPSSAVTSSFARLAQAYNLQGRVIRHCDEQDQDLAFMLDEMGALHHALSALSELTTTEGSEHFYVSTAVCFR